MVRKWGELRADLERRLERRFSRAWLAGSSNGAYFLSMLAVRGDIRVDGFAALSGGARVGTPNREAPKVPFLVAYGSYDATKSDGKGLAAYLLGAGWPVTEREHRLDHGAKPEYLDDIVEVFAHGR
jgi:predicted esterase